MTTSSNLPKGITFEKDRNRYRAFARVNNVQTSIGSSKTVEGAVALREEFFKQLETGISQVQLAKNKNRIERFELILKTCKVQTNSSSMADIAFKNQETIKQDMDLLTFFGYLKKEMKTHSTYNQNTNFYETLIETFKITDLVKMLEHLAVEKKKIKINESQKPTVENAVKVTTESLADKILLQSQARREELKKRHTINYVCGSSLLMF